MDSKERLTLLLHAANQRLTRQRLLILKILEKSRQHLDAESLFHQAREHDPGISMATIYRTLTLFKEIGFVQDDRLGENHAHFEKVGDHPHHHFTCIKCGCVIEFTAPEVERVMHRLNHDQGLVITEANLSLVGYCDPCSKSGISSNE